MFNIPEQYKINVKLALKDFIPKDLKLEDKKRIREAIKEVRLIYQIAGEGIPSVINEEYRCQAIQIYDMELHNMKDAAYLASMYQKLIKSLCVIHMYDSKEELYSLAVKRLNQIDETQTVIERSILTTKYPMGLPDFNRKKLLQYLDFEKTKNKTNKVNLYKEWFYKAYMLENEKAYSGIVNVLEGNQWYDAKKMESMFQLFESLVDIRTRQKKAISNAERMKWNKEIKVAIQALDKNNK